MNPRQKSDFYFFVEGPDDRRFFDIIICPLIRSQYKQLRIIEYSQLSTKTVCNYLNAINKDGNKYIFVHDLDHCPCITRRKELLRESYQSIELSNILVVVKKIEGWYLASITQEVSVSIGIPKQSRTENIDKGKFEMLMQKSKIFDNSRISFLNKLLEAYSTEIAVNHNKFLNYLIRRIKRAS